MICSRLRSGIASRVSQRFCRRGRGSPSRSRAIDPRVLETLDSMASRGTFFEPTLDVTLRSVAHFEAEGAATPSVSEEYARATVGFSMAVAREAAKRRVRIVAGTDHVAYGPRSDRASLVGGAGAAHRLGGPVTPRPRCSPPRATRRSPSAATRPARSAASRRAATPTSSSLRRIRWRTSATWRRSSGSCRAGKVWRPWQLRSGIASAGGRAGRQADGHDAEGPALTHPGH